MPFSSQYTNLIGRAVPETVAGEDDDVGVVNAGERDGGDGVSGEELPLSRVVLPPRKSLCIIFGGSGSVFFGCVVRKVYIYWGLCVGLFSFCNCWKLVAFGGEF